MFKQTQTQNQKIQDPYARMPKVHQMSGIEDLFAEARRKASEEQYDGGRHIVIVTPERKFLIIPCPPPGSMAQEKVTEMEQSFKHGKGANVAVIAYNEFQEKETASMRELAEKIPFFGFLLGFAYVGQNVWMFEGHPSALAAGCRDADVLVVDSGMIPHLQKDWVSVATKVMRIPEIHIHDRKTYSLRRMSIQPDAADLPRSANKTKILGMDTWQIAILGIMFIIIICVIVFAAIMLFNYISL